jgi:lysophospholipase
MYTSWEHSLVDKECLNISSGEFRLEGHKDHIYFKNITPKTADNPYWVIVFHDFFDYHGRYLALAEELVIKGNGRICVGLFDYPGFGKSGGTRAHIPDFDQLCRVSSEFLHFLCDKHDLEEFFLVGAGLGATVLLKLEDQFFHRFRRRPKGLVLSNPLLKMNIETPTIGQPMMDFFSGSLAKIKLPWRIKGDYLTHDYTLSEQFDLDPLTQRSITLATYNQLLLNSQLMRTSAYFLDVPTLLLLSADDEFLDQDVSKLFARGFNREVGKLIEYSQSKHDLFNEVDREKVFSDVYNWIDQRISN